MVEKPPVTGSWPEKRGGGHNSEQGVIARQYGTYLIMYAQCLKPSSGYIHVVLSLINRYAVNCP